MSIDKKEGEIILEDSNINSASLNKEAWLRYFARVIDITIGTMILGAILGIILGIFFVIFGVNI